MVGSTGSITDRVVGTYAGMLGVAIVWNAVETLIDVMHVDVTATAIALSGVAVGSAVTIIGVMIVFASDWARTTGFTFLPVVAVFCAVRFGATNSVWWGLGAVANVVFFVALLRHRPSESADIDEETSGVWVGTTHR